MDRVKIIEPNGVERTRPLTVNGLTIGRGHDSDIMLGYDNVSRYHAKISLGEQGFLVTDLGSSNGTFLGDFKLDANTPTVWEPNLPLRIGNVSIYLQLSQRSTAALPMGGRETTSSETVYWLPEELPRQNGKRTMLWILLLLAAVACCGALGAVGYINYFN